MTLKELKKQHLDKFSQFVLLNEEGVVLDSCDSIFKVESLNSSSVLDKIPLIESVSSTVFSLKVGDPPIVFARVEKPFSSLPGYYDFSFSRVILNGTSAILWVIYDYTSIYEDLLKYQQKRNELEIHRQLLEQTIKKLKS